MKRKQIFKGSNGKCIDCAHAKLYRYKPENPIIACCMLTMTRQVANTNPYCGVFKKTNQFKQISMLYE